MKLTTDTELAERFDITVEKLHTLRKQNGWPFVRFGRFDIRFTDQQVEAIVAAQSVTPATKQPDTSGLTAKSANRKRTA